MKSIHHRSRFSGRKGATLAKQPSGSVPRLAASSARTGVSRVFGGIAATVLLIFALGTCGALAGEFKLVPGSFDVMTTDQNGHADTQAGGHPFAVTSKFELVSEPDVRGRGTRVPKGALLKTASVAVPPGLIGNGVALPQCGIEEFLHPAYFNHTCFDNAQIGNATLNLNFYGGTQEERTVGVYNVTPAVGQPARIGFLVLTDPVLLVPHVRSDGDYGVTVEGNRLDDSLAVIGVKLELWGVPGSPLHDAARGNGHGECSAAFVSPPCIYQGTYEAFLTNPVNCSAGPLTSSIFVESWKEETDTATSVSHDEFGNPVGMTGCAHVPFEPSVSVQSSVGSAETASGLKFELGIPSEGVVSPTGIAQAELKKAVVRLPEGMTINPSAGEGLGACTPADYAREQLRTPPDEGCPNESKLGSVKIDTPLLAEPLEGSVFLAQPDDPATSSPGAENPFDSLVAIYVVARLPERGIIIKSAGKVIPDPRTGQLVTTFDDLPELPFSKFTMMFREGARAPLATPATCGTYTTKVELTPWSAAHPDNPSPSEVTSVESPLEVSSGVGAGGCPSDGAPPFQPSVRAGTSNNKGGSDSPLYARIARNDGEQEITRFSTVLPEGLTGNLSGIPFCPDGAIEASKGVTGAQELASPSCPAASEVGHAAVGAGVGAVLAWTSGKLYLAGPYHGASLSLVSITSAKVGPFDLGTVVIRFALKINPITAQVEVDATGSDPIPHIIKGIVVHVRDIHVYVDRPSFIRNPTNCNAKVIQNEITGAGADFTNLTGQVPVAASTRFQAADCASLKFKPKFEVSTSGRTTRKNGASLNVKLTFPAARGQANIRYVKVALPKQLPSRLVTLQKACRAEVFNVDPAGCPAESRVGVAKAVTPILPVPLVGPAYFVSYGGAKFPELVSVLQGYGIRIDLHGETFIKNGITTSTFKAVPDQPVTSFELNLPQGKFSALAANGNLCKQKLAMPTEFIAQNGAVVKRATKINATGCAKAKKHAHRKKHKQAKKHR